MGYNETTAIKGDALKGKPQRREQLEWNITLKKKMNGWVRSRRIASKKKKTNHLSARIQTDKDLR